MTLSSTTTLGLLTLTLALGGTTAAQCQDYAASVVASSNLSANPLLSDPNAALGQPTTLFEDPGIFDQAGEYHASIVNPAYYTTSSGGNALAGLGSTGAGSLTVKLADPISHSDSHWYGDDFIVYGNSTFSGANATTGDYSVTPTTDMSQYVIDNFGIYQNGTPTVSVSADGVHFVQLMTSQTFFPENPYSWAGNTAANPSGWGALNDFTKPIDPTLTQADFVNKSVAFADNTLYDGSAGGQAFSLLGSGLTSVQYIKFTGFGNIDGVVGVSNNPAAVPEASTITAFSLLLALGLSAVRRKRAV